MIVRLKKAWKIWPVGHVFSDMPQNQALALIGRGIGEEVRGPAKAGLRAGRDYVTRTAKKDRG